MKFHGNWRGLLKQAAMRETPFTAEEIRDIVSDGGLPADVLTPIRAAKIKCVVVGKVPKEEGQRGTRRKLYRIEFPS